MTTVTTLGVTGMTCGNCVKHVTAEIEAIPGVEDVSVMLTVGGVSQVRVFSDEPLAPAALRAAVDEAGYEVDSIAVRERAQAAEYAGHADEIRAARGCGGHNAELRTGPLPTVAAAATGQAEQVTDDAPRAGGCGCGGHGGGHGHGGHGHGGGGHGHGGGGGCGCGEGRSGAGPAYNPQQRTYSLTMPPTPPVSIAPEAATLDAITLGAITTDATNPEATTGETAPTRS